MTMPLMAQHINVSTNNTSLILDAHQGGGLQFVYYGQHLNERETEQLFSDGRQHLDAYPAYGMQTQHETALSVVHSDGNMTLDLAVEAIETRSEANATVKVVKMKDKYYPFYVNVCYRTYPDKDIIETWTEYSHKEKGTVKLTQFASAYLPIRYGQVWLSHLYSKFVIVLGFGIFCFADMKQLGNFFLNAFGISMVTNGNAFADQITWSAFVGNIFLMIAAVLCSLPILPKIKHFFFEFGNNVVYTTGKVLGAVGCAYLLVMCSILLVDTTNNPFLYFRF